MLANKVFEQYIAGECYNTGVADAHRVLAGETISQYFDLDKNDPGVDIRAEEDGWAFTNGGDQNAFLSDAEFAQYLTAGTFRLANSDLQSAFDVHAYLKSQEPGYSIAFIIPDDTPYRYVELDQAVVIDFLEGPFKAVPGQMLIENPHDEEDGFTLMEREQFLRNFSIVKEAGPSNKSVLKEPKIA